VDEGLAELVFFFLMTVSLAEWGVAGDEWSEDDKGKVLMRGADEVVVMVVVVVPLVNIPEEVVVVVVVVVVAGMSSAESKPCVTGSISGGSMFTVDVKSGGSVSIFWAIAKAETRWERRNAKAELFGSAK